MKVLSVAALLLVLIFPLAGVSQEKPTDEKKPQPSIDELASKLPRVKPLTPAESLKQFQIR